jgi:uncharacterized membrane protein
MFDTVQISNKFLWGIFIFFALAVGCYPLIYGFVDMHNKGLLQSKSAELLHNPLWKSFFFFHISFGGLALLTGWYQFIQKRRQRYLNLHRWLGRFYVIAVLISGTAGLYIAFYATGGLISILGFGLLALCWLFSDVMGYVAIRKLDVLSHKKWMIRNYALTFAAVTLRVWLPLMMLPFFHIAFLDAYHVVAWLCWVPNLIAAEMFIRNR